MTRQQLRSAWLAMRRAALDRSRIDGLTHRFYRYPARFSPTFVTAAVEALSEQGSIVLDPYMGGGTTPLVATALGRHAVGCDVNSLSVFLARLKLLRLTPEESDAVAEWVERVVPRLVYTAPPPIGTFATTARYANNLSAPRSRALKKVLGLGLASLDALPTDAARRFARGILLNAGQWALNGKRSRTTAANLRERVKMTAHTMLDALKSTNAQITERRVCPVFIHGSAEDLPLHEPFLSGSRADLVVTSPPYPGIHVLYHRWQVDGRRESAAPYWIAGCMDGQGSSFYNFADRRNPDDSAYFERSLATLRGIRDVTRDGAFVVQLIAFSQPDTQLRRYLQGMQSAGFREVRLDRDLGYSTHRRAWRDVPSRNWHAQLKGQLSGSREVLLWHIAS